MVKQNRGEHMMPMSHQTNEKGESDMGRYSKKMPLEEAMKEVHTNVPKTVKATGKTGAAKESMLRAIAFSKAGEGKK